MKEIEILAVVEYDRPLPGYALGCDSTQQLRAFLDGSRPLEKELRGLESFRRAVITLAEEGLSMPAGCERDEDPFVNVSLSAGAHLRKPTMEFGVSLGLERWGGVPLWVLGWQDDEGRIRRPACMDAGQGLKIMKSLLDRKTAQWASLVAFQASHVDP